MILDAKTGRCVLEELGEAITKWSTEDKAWAREQLIDAHERWLRERLLHTPPYNDRIH
jgi:hypothetical protein